MKYCSTGHEKALTLSYEAPIAASPWPAVASDVSTSSDHSLTSEDSNAPLLLRFELSPPSSLLGSPASLPYRPHHPKRCDCKEVICLMVLTALRKSACLCMQLQNSTVSHMNF